MSASTSRAVVSRLCSRFPINLFNGKRPTNPLKSSSLPPNPSPKRISPTSRLPVQLSSLLSTMPLHSAIASSRLISALSAESQTWGLIPLGISMPL